MTDNIKKYLKEDLAKLKYAKTFIRVDNEDYYYATSMKNKFDVSKAVSQLNRDGFDVKIITLKDGKNIVGYDLYIR